MEEETNLICCIKENIQPCWGIAYQVWCLSYKVWCP